MAPLTPFEIFRVRNRVGEGILWDAHREVLWWTDIQERRLHRFDWARGTMQILQAPDRVGSFGLIAGSEQLIAAFAGGIAIYDIYQQSVDWLARPPPLGPDIRFNDGRVDRRGRFWSGTMSEGEQPAPNGCLYSIEARSEARCHIRGITISNGLCFSPDGSHLYFADSPTRQIKVYELFEPDGVLSAPRLFTRTPEGAFPDGATVDVDGCVWCAHWGASCVVRYRPDGRVDRTIDVPTCQPTCVCFAGPSLDILCVTSARDGLNGATLDAEPHAGDVFLYRTGVQGLPEAQYRR